MMSKLLGGPFRLVVPRRAYAPPDAPLPRKRSRTLMYPRHTRADECLREHLCCVRCSTYRAPQTAPQNIAHEYENDPRFLDRATANWRRDQEREWR